jgi:Domain of unknown function (DUF1905)/Bacteriocin-protection, YdeI or OmpD-Associated
LTKKNSTTKQAKAKAPATKATAAPASKRFRATLEKHAGSAAAMLTVPFDVQKVFGTRARVPVRCTINGFTFRSSIFPTGEGTHYMVVNREARAGAGVEAGATITMTMERDTEPRVVTPPAELARALRRNKAARAAWDKLSYTHQKEHARAVEEAKRPETRDRRVERAIAEISAGKKPRG